MFADLEVGALTRVLRPTMLVAILLGAVGAGIALLLSQPLAAVGIVIGVGLAILNLRSLGAGVVKVQINGESDGKVIRRLLRGRSFLRLAVLTVIAIGALLISPMLGLGIVVGLVVFQLSFVVNAGRAIMREGIS
jgi:hypothetical protein